MAVAEQENVDPVKLSGNVRKPVGPRKTGAAVSAPQTQKPLPVKKHTSSVDLELAEIEKKRREAKELAEKNSCRMKKKCAVAADGMVLQADSQTTKAEATLPVSKETVKRADSARALRPRSSPPNNRTKPENTLRERTSVVQLAATTTKAPVASTTGSRTSPLRTGRKPGSPMPVSGSTVAPGVGQRAASVRSASLHRRTKPECTVATSVETVQPDSTNRACILPGSAETESGPADHPGRTGARTSPLMSRAKSDVITPSTKPKVQAAASGKKGLSSADLEMAEIEKKRREAKELAEKNFSRMKKAAPTDDQPVPVPVVAESESGAVAPVNPKAKPNESKEFPPKTPRRLPVRSAVVGPPETSPCKKTQCLAADLKTASAASPAPLRRRTSPSKSETSPSIVRRQSPSKPDVSTKRSVLPTMLETTAMEDGHRQSMVACCEDAVAIVHDGAQENFEFPEDSITSAIPDEAQESSKVSDGDASTVVHSIDENVESLKGVELTSRPDAVDEKTECLEVVHSSTVQDVRSESAAFVQDVETVNQVGLEKQALCLDGVGLRAEQDVLESAANQSVLEEQTVCFDDVGLTAEQDFLEDKAVCLQHVDSTADQDEVEEQTMCFEDVATAVVNDVREEKVACIQHVDTIANKDSVSEQTIVLEENGCAAEQTVLEEVVDEKTVCVEDVEPVKEQYVGESTAAQDGVDEKMICMEDAELTANSVAHLNHDESTGRIETNESAAVQDVVETSAQS